MRRMVAGLAIALGALVSGCVSRDAGVGLARSEVRSRTGMDLASSEAAADPEINAIVGELLTKPLTPDSAARIALLNNADVQAALADVGVVRGNLISALRAPNPKVGLGASFYKERTTLDIEATIELLDLFLLPARQEVADAALEAAALQAAGEALDVAFEAKSSFYEWQAASQSLGLRKTVLYAAAQASDITSRLLEAGNIPPLDALAQQAVFEEARLAVARAELEQTRARERVNTVLGLHGKAGAGWRAAAELPEPIDFDDEGLERRAVEASLELRVQEKRHLSAASRADLAWTQGLVPELEAGVSAEREDRTWGVGPTVTLSIPLFYQGQGEVAAAEAEMRGAESRHRAAATGARATARVVSERIRVSRESAAFFRTTLLPLRERILDETLRTYNAMDAGPIQLLTAKRDQIETMTAYVATLRDYWIARTEAELLLAGRTPTLSAPRAASPAASASEAGDH